MKKPDIHVVSVTHCLETKFRIGDEVEAWFESEASKIDPAWQLGKPGIILDKYQ